MQMGQAQLIEETEGPGLKLKVLSWNIDGLDERDTIKRTNAVCQLIYSRRPHIVFFTRSCSTYVECHQI